jgi:hypothetical protein
MAVYSSQTSMIIGDRAEVLFDIEVSYRRVPASGDGFDEPHEPEHCEIDWIFAQRRVTNADGRTEDAGDPIDITGWLTESQIEILADECLADWRGAREQALVDVRRDA